MKTVLITGCSSGIGKSLAREFHKQGYKVFAGARRLENMSDLAELGINTFKLDVTNQESVEAAKASLEKELDGRLDILYNNAGCSLNSVAANTPVEKSQSVFDVNYFGVQRMINAFSPWIIKSKGMIVATGSVVVDLSPPWVSHYTASKAALRSLLQVLTRELKPYGVKVVEVNTGNVTTDIPESTPLVKVPEDSPLAASNDSMLFSKKMLGGVSKQTADDYARAVITQLVKRKDSGMVLGGANSWAAIFISHWLPKFVFNKIMTDMYKMDKIEV